MQINAWHTKLNVNSVIPVIAVSGKMLRNESFIWNDMAGYTKRHYQRVDDSLKLTMINSG